MKHYYPIFILIMILFLFVVGGCPKIPSVCDDNAESNLCKIVGKYDIQLEYIGDFLIVVNLRTIKESKTYTKEKARQILLDIQRKYHTTAGLTIADLRTYILKYVIEYPELILAKRYINYLNVPETLTKKDIEILDGHIEQQLILLK